MKVELKALPVDLNGDPIPHNGRSATVGDFLSLACLANLAGDTGETKVRAYVLAKRCNGLEGLTNDFDVDELSFVKGRCAQALGVVIYGWLVENIFT